MKTITTISCMLFLTGAFAQFGNLGGGNVLNTTKQVRKTVQNPTGAAKDIVVGRSETAGKVNNTIENAWNKHIEEQERAHKQVMKEETEAERKAAAQYTSYKDLSKLTFGQYKFSLDEQVGESVIEMIDLHMPDSVDLLVLIDNTGSMKPAISSVKRMTNMILSSLPTGSSMGAASFNDKKTDPKHWYKSQTLVSDYKKATGFVNGISAYGGGDKAESMYDGIATAIKENKWTKKDRAIIVISDAPPLTMSDRTDHQHADIVSLCQKNDINLYTIQCK